VETGRIHERVLEIIEENSGGRRKINI